MYSGKNAPNKFNKYVPTHFQPTSTKMKDSDIQKHANIIADALIEACVTRLTLTLNNNFVLKTGNRSLAGNSIEAYLKHYKGLQY
jgi:hypothetical protein